MMMMCNSKTKCKLMAGCVMTTLGLWMLLYRK